MPQAAQFLFASRLSWRRPSRENSEVTRSKRIPERDGCVSEEKYLPGDFELMDQYVVKTLGQLPGGNGREWDCNKIHG